MIVSGVTRSHARNHLERGKVFSCPCPLPSRYPYPDCDLDRVHGHALARGEAVCPICDGEAEEGEADCDGQRATVDSGAR